MAAMSMAHGPSWRRFLFFSPLFFGSAVLPNGELLVEGGEYNALNAVWTNMGALYNPVTNKWTKINPPAGWTSIGDAQNVILNNGTDMQANCCTTQFAYFNPIGHTWTAFSGNGKFDVFDEEGFNLLPNGEVLSVDAYVFQYDATGMNSELYNPTTEQWSSAGSTGVQLWDSHCGIEADATYELGPAVLRPDGTVFATGANTCGAGRTAIYDTATATWSNGPDFPGKVSVADGPASIEINGKSWSWAARTKALPPPSMSGTEPTSLLLSIRRMPRTMALSMATC